MLKNKPEKQAYTVEEASEVLSLSRSTLYGLIQSGKMGSIKVGRARRITARQLQDFLERQEHLRPW